MDADDQNVEAGITGAGSGKPPASRSAFLPGAAAGTAAVPGTMRAAVLDALGPPSALAIRELPVPVPSAGQVLIKVRSGTVQPRWYARGRIPLVLKPWEERNRDHGPSFPGLYG